MRLEQRRGEAFADAASGASARNRCARAAVRTSRSAFKWKFALWRFRGSRCSPRCATP